ncbi:PST family polysaccharide transporter [Winogradskyella epiphytica]|uniref:PST family polysaccharide transporter n=1 Tax=Winogradskyella epiphytica TaxID=262005 RepID=A0A2V4XCQ8_9FLAO|nr:O-antigen translocase [Winogradskyella epiphytica]PYE80120.1 PST family polysaccharide transporter [Winogradskyella epiphytica]GGW71561.1 LPS biosynthesis protein [Winogradskyella epiphytica]
MKIPKFLSNNIVLKITSLNAVVITIRLVLSAFVQRLLAVTVGEAGYASIGQIRNLLAMLTATSTLGTFSGLVKYVAEFKQDQSELTKIFSTVSCFLLMGSIGSAAVLFFGATFLSDYLFNSQDYIYLFQLLAVIVPFIGIGRVVNAVVSGLSDYKKYAKIELISYLLATIALVIGLYISDLTGILIAISIAPVIQLIVLAVVFGKTLQKYVHFKTLKLRLVYKNKLLAFTLMSFVSTFLLNYVELDIRTMVAEKINVNEAGYWTAVTFISKNYMVFATGLFTLYVLPKFASINGKVEFKSEVINIYKTILPIFALGMLIVYLLRDYIIKFIFPDFIGMEPLFKWQLMGDFVRLSSLVLAHQFLAKRLVKSFIFTEIISLGLFFGLTQLFIPYFGTEGVVIAHLVRYILYFVIVVVVIKAYFNKASTA